MKKSSRFIGKFKQIIEDPFIQKSLITGLIIVLIGLLAKPLYYWALILTALIQAGAH